MKCQRSQIGAGSTLWHSGARKSNWWRWAMSGPLRRSDTHPDRHPGRPLFKSVFEQVVHLPDHCIHKSFVTMTATGIRMLTCHSVDLSGVQSKTWFSMYWAIWKLDKQVELLIVKRSKAILQNIFLLFFLYFTLINEFAVNKLELHLCALYLFYNVSYLCKWIRVFSQLNYH